MPFELPPPLWLPPKPAIIRAWKKEDARLLSRRVLPAMLMVNQLIGFGAGGRAATFVGATTVNGAANTVSWPAGTQAGDIAIFVLATGAAPTITDFSSWNADFGPINIATAAFIAYGRSKVLTAADISTPPAYSGATNGGYSVAVWRGGAAVTFKTSVADQTGSTCSITGYAKNANHILAVAICVDRDPGNDIAAPSGFIERHESAITFADFCWADSEAYVSSAAMQYSNLATSNNQAGASWELT